MRASHHNFRCPPNSFAIQPTTVSSIPHPLTCAQTSANTPHAYLSVAHPIETKLAGSGSICSTLCAVNQLRRVTLGASDKMVLNTKPKGVQANVESPPNAGIGASYNIAGKDIFSLLFAKPLLKDQAMMSRLKPTTSPRTNPLRTQSKSWQRTGA